MIFDNLEKSKSYRGCVGLGGAVRSTVAAIVHANLFG